MELADSVSGDEFSQMLDQLDSQSPDLGPPPIARFDADPVGFDAGLRPTQEPQSMQQRRLEEPDPTLSVNLESRKKRREPHKPNARRVSVFRSPDNSGDGSIADEGATGIRVGAKRKMGMREDAENADAQPQSPESFHFSRRNAIDKDQDATDSLFFEKAILGDSKFAKRLARLLRLTR